MVRKRRELGSAIGLEVAGSGPVSCCCFHSLLFLTMRSSLACLSFGYTMVCIDHLHYSQIAFTINYMHNRLLLNLYIDLKDAYMYLNNPVGEDR